MYEITTDVDKYQKWVDEGWSKRRNKDGVDPNDYLRNLFIMSTGVGGEAGEVQELLKKHVRDGVLDKSKLVHELGDVLYYLSRISSFFGASLGEVMVANQLKLIKRRLVGKENEDKVDLAQLELFPPNCS